MAALGHRSTAAKARHSRSTRSRGSRDEQTIPERVGWRGGVDGELGDLVASAFFGNPSPELEKATDGVGRGCAARPSVK